MSLPYFSVHQRYSRGFDATINPRWCMVRLQRKRLVALIDGPGLQLRSAEPHVASAEFDTRPSSDPRVRAVWVSGHKAGHCLIHAVAGQQIRATLRVGVYPRRVVKVNFYPVKDKQGNVPRFNASKAQGLIRRANAIYKYQCNLIFQTHNVAEKPIHIPIDFASENQSTKQQANIWKVLRKKHMELDPAPGHYSVFWVKIWGARDTMQCVNGHWVKRDVIGTSGDRIGSHILVMEEMKSLRDQSLLLAHELGHSLNAHHDEAHSQALMYPTLEGHDYILKETVDQIRGPLS